MKLHIPLPKILSCVVLTLALIIPSALTAAPKPAVPLPTATPDGSTLKLPALLVCQGENGLSRFSFKTSPEVLFLDGDIHDVQAQKGGGYLVTDGRSQVSFLKRNGNQYQVDWSWDGLNVPCLVNAVTAEQEWNGEPSLVLASDCTMNRLFLAETGTATPKIRWEINLPAPPQRVSLCGDSGNFLVSLKVDPRQDGLGGPPQVAEIFYKEDRVGWSLDARANGISRTQDALRDKFGRTLVVAGRKPELLCFDLAKNVLWRLYLNNTRDASHTLSLMNAQGRELLLVVARPAVTIPAAGNKPARAKRPTGLYVVDPVNGKILMFKRSLDDQKGPAPMNIVPDDFSFVTPGK